MSVVLLNGQPVGADDLRALALVNYGHFSSMQVRGRAVQGLELHRQRLESATRELFGSDLDFQSVREHMRRAVADNPDCSLRVTIFSRQFDYRKPSEACEPDVFLSVTPASAPSGRAIRVKSFPFQRPVPLIKHVGTFPLFHYRRLAVQGGFDDALFVDAGGVVSEGSIWNIGFWDGEGIVWPDAPALRGTAEQLLQTSLGALGIKQVGAPVSLADLGRFSAAFACNATGLQSIASIDETRFGSSGDWRNRLDKVLENQPWQMI